MAGMRGGGFGGGRGNGGRPWGGEGPVGITLPLPQPRPSNSSAPTASPLPTTPSTVAQNPSHTPSEPAQTTELPPSPSLPPVSVPSSGDVSTSHSPIATDTSSHELASDTQTSGATSVQETAEGSASISVSFTIVDGQTIRFVTTVTTPSEATAATAANAPSSSSRGGIVAVATLSALLLAALSVALGIFLLGRRRQRARAAVPSSFIHGSADSSDSDVAPAIRAFSKEPRISRPLPVSNRDSNVLDEENARLREAVARLQVQLEDLGHLDNPSLPAYDSHSSSAASIHSYLLQQL